MNKFLEKNKCNKIEFKNKKFKKWGKNHNEK
jgi:hypothetical protein